ncbi:palmitoyltransferase ZDHHC17-like [Saccoglossus kowalevskii]|uniref:Palmitoyltransferase n=1 Tax=Saccoglossus kowalevskii TaxID=10224 RepID=A0ABM0MD94_SACKO|nr:PREDICTED: palmitoyltransferase ZDHHC17-like [Saccoglossus kowalevskii]
MAEYGEEASCNHTILPGHSHSHGVKPYPVQPQYDPDTPYPLQPPQPPPVSGPAMMDIDLDGLHTQQPIQKEQEDYSTWDIVKATQYGIMDRVKYLIEQEGYDVNQPDDENVSLLHWGAINNRLELCKYLILKGALVDRTGGELNSTPLHWATRQGHLPMVILLMQYGADPSIRDGEGCSGVHLSSQFGHTAILAYLIAKGQDPNMLDQNGMTPLMWSCYRMFVVDPARLLIKMGASVNLQDKVHQNTALHWAIMSGNANVMPLLLQNGTDTYIENSKGEDVLKMAASKKNLYVFKKIQDHRGDTAFKHVGILHKLSMSKVCRTRVMYTLPFVTFFVIGFIPELDYSIAIKLLLFGLCYVLFWFLSKLFFDERYGNIMPISVYLATKVLMYSSWFFYYWPYINSMSIHIPFFIISALLLYNFVKAWRSDPGVITTSFEEKKRTIIELAETGKLKIEVFCTTCIIRKPIRSKHCSYCNRCIAKFDHHCPWIDNCVGAGNHKYFIGYLFFLEIMIIWCLYGTIQFWNGECETNFEEDGIFAWLFQVMKCSPWVFWTSVNALVHVVWVGLLFICQMYQISALGMSTNERMNQTRYKHFRHEKGRIRSPFNNGYIRNIVNFFEIRCCGLCRPMKIDWKTQFDMDIQSTGSYTYKPLSTQENYQFV